MANRPQFGHPCFSPWPGSLNFQKATSCGSWTSENDCMWLRGLASLATPVLKGGWLCLTSTFLGEGGGKPKEKKREGWGMLKNEHKYMFFWKCCPTPPPQTHHHTQSRTQTHSTLAWLLETKAKKTLPKSKWCVITGLESLIIIPQSNGCLRDKSHRLPKGRSRGYSLTPQHSQVNEQSVCVCLKLKEANESNSMSPLTYFWGLFV